MATIHSDPQANGRDANRRVPPANAGKHPPASVLDLLGPDDPLHQEMEHLLADNHQPPRTDRPGASLATASACNHHSSIPAEPVPLSENEELTVLRVENAQLRARVEELEQFLEATTNQTEQMWAEQQKEFELLLDEKSEVIRALHQQLQEAKHQEPAEVEVPAATNSDDPVALRKELAALREQMEIERLQLEEDEKSLMHQMREMEMAMSKERVEMARQRSELQRLHKDLQHEIERAEKDGGLRERLISLQRRSQAEASTHSAPARTPQQAPAPKPPQGQLPPPRRAMPTQNVLPGPGGDANGARPGSGFLRRLFG